MDVNNKKEAVKSIDIGRLLIEARENLDLTTQDIATHMNLTIDIIIKIENNDFVMDIPVAFIRGYIKSYATKVGLDTGPMLKEFDKQIGVESPSLKRAQTISSFDVKRKEINSSHFLFKSVSILILLAFLSFAGWELWNRFVVNDQNQSDVKVLADSDISTQLKTNDDNVELFDNKAEEEIPEPSSENPLGSTTETQNELPNNTSPAINSRPVGNTEVSDLDLIQNNRTDQPLQQEVVDTSDLIMTSLVLDFSADCWVKIVDARGEVLALGVKKSGKHMPIEGVAPINVILGDPSVVTMTYDGLEYDLSGYRAGRRADFILE